MKENDKKIVNIIFLIIKVSEKLKLFFLMTSFNKILIKSFYFTIEKLNYFLLNLLYSFSTI